MARSTIGGYVALQGDVSWTLISGNQYYASLSVVVPSLGANRVLVLGFSELLKDPQLTSLDSVTWDYGGAGQAMTLLTPVNGSSNRTTAAYVIGGTANATITVRLVATFGGVPGSDLTSVVVQWADADGTLAYDTSATIDTTTIASPNYHVDLSLSLGDTGVVFSFSSSAANANVSPYINNATTLDQYDGGGNCAICGYSDESSGGTITHQHLYSQNGQATTGYILSFVESGGNNPPSAPTPITADDTTFNDSTPTVEVTQTDTDADVVRANVRITDNPDAFTGGNIVKDSYESGSGLVVHLQQSGGAVTTWQGYPQLDDRPGGSFEGGGGILHEIDVNIGPNDGAGGVGKTAGYARLLVYAHGGTYGESSAPLNQATPANTPTPGWIAESVWLYCDGDGGMTDGWNTFSFTGANRIRSIDGTKYCDTLDWIPDDSDLENIILCRGDNITLTHAGNLYIDGAAVYNWGPWGTYSRRLTCAISSWSGAFQIGDTIEDDTSGGTGTIIMTNGATNPATQSMQIVFQLNSPYTEFTSSGTITNNSRTGAGTAGTVSNKNSDFRHRVRETFILLDKVSGTDAGFVDETDASSDPFPSGHDISYTVQAGEALADGEYRWDWRSIDPSGSNTYGPRMTARTFTVATSTPLVVVANVITFSAPSAVASGGAVTVAATAPTVTLSAPSATIATGGTPQTLNATAPVVAITVPASAISAETILASTAPVITVNTPAAILTASVALSATAPVVTASVPSSILSAIRTFAVAASLVTFTAPTATATAAVTVLATTPVVTHTAPATSLVAGTSSVVATTPTVTWSAPVATASTGGAPQTLETTTPVVTLSIFSTTVSSGAVSVSATTPTTTISAPATTLGIATSVPATAPVITWTAATVSLLVETTVSATAPAITFSPGAATPVSVTSLQATAPAVSVSAPAAQAGPGAVSVAATGPFITLSTPTATLVQEGGPQTLEATAPVVSITAPTTIVSAGAVTLAATAPVVTATTPATTLSTELSLSATAPVVTATAGPATISAGGATVSATAPVLSITAPTASVGAGASPQTIEASAAIVTITAPVAITVSGVATVPATTPTITWTAPTTTNLMATSLVATVPVVTWSTPVATVGLGESAVLATAPVVLITAPSVYLVQQGGPQTLDVTAPVVTWTAPSTSVSAGSISIVATAPAVTITIGTATITPSTEVLATAPFITVTGPSVVVTGATTVVATAPTVSLTAPISSVSTEASITLTVPFLTVTAPSVSLAGVTTVAVNAVVANFTAPVTTVVTGAATILATSPTVTFSTPFALCRPDDAPLDLPAGTPVITTSAPTAVILGEIWLVPGAPTVTFTCSAPWVELEYGSIEEVWFDAYFTREVWFDAYLTREVWFDGQITKEVWFNASWR